MRSCPAESVTPWLSCEAVAADLAVYAPVDLSGPHFVRASSPRAAPPATVHASRCGSRALLVPSSNPRGEAPQS